MRVLKKKVIFSLEKSLKKIQNAYLESILLWFCVKELEVRVCGCRLQEHFVTQLRL